MGADFLLLKKVLFIAFTISLSSSCLYNLVAKLEVSTEDACFIVAIVPVLEQVPALHNQVPA